MIKVQDIKNGIMLIQNAFNTNQIANAWIAEQEALKAFGKPDRWVSEDRIAIEGEDIGLAIDTITEPINGVDVTLYKFAKEYTINIVDLSADPYDIVDKGLRKQNFGASIVAQVYAINEKKISNGTFNNTIIQALLTNATLAQIERMLFNGSLATAKVLIQSLDNTYYTAGEKSFIIGLIDEYLAGG